MALSVDWGSTLGEPSLLVASQFTGGILRLHSKSNCGHNKDDGLRRSDRVRRLRPTFYLSRAPRVIHAVRIDRGDLQLDKATPFSTLHSNQIRSLPEIKLSRPSCERLPKHTPTQ